MADLREDVTRGASCPRCHSRRVVDGRLVQGSVGFQPIELQVPWYTLKTAWASVDQSATTCFDCGLCWSSVNLGKAFDVVRTFGTQELKERIIGASLDLPVPASSPSPEAESLPRPADPPTLDPNQLPRLQEP